MSDILIVHQYGNMTINVFKMHFDSIILQPEGKHSMLFGQVLIDGFLFNGAAGFMIEQRLIWIAG